MHLHSPKLLITAACCTLVLAGCASSTKSHTITLPCERSRAEVTASAREFLASMGFTARVDLPDSGYYRTAALKVQTVSEISSGAPLWFVVEVQSNGREVQVTGARLVYGNHSEALRYGASPEDEAQTEEEGLMPSQRAYGVIVRPLVEHLQKFCAQQ